MCDVRPPTSELIRSLTTFSDTIFYTNCQSHHALPTILNSNAAIKDGSSEDYAASIDAIIQPLLGRTYDSISSLDEEVRLVSASVFLAALITIPTQTKKGHLQTSRIEEPM